MHPEINYLTFQFIFSLSRVYKLNNSKLIFLIPNQTHLASIFVIYLFIIIFCNLFFQFFCIIKPSISPSYISVFNYDVPINHVQLFIYNLVKLLLIDITTVQKTIVRKI